MMTNVWDNCILYLEGMIPWTLRTGICIAAVVMMLARLIGVPLASLVTRMPRTMSLLVRILLFVFVLPAPTLTGMLVCRLCAMDTALTTAVRATFPSLNQVTLSSALGALIVSFPILVLFAIAALHRVNPETVFAARTLGMKDSIIRRRVILPQARSGIAAGVILCGARALGESTATAAALADPAVLQGDLLSVFLADIMNGSYAMACLWIAAWLLVGGIVLFLYHLCHRVHGARLIRQRKVR